MNLFKKRVLILIKVFTRYCENRKRTIYSETPNGNKVSACTVRRRLISLGYKSHTAKSKPLKTPAQIEQRLTLAKNHQHWFNEWNKVIWNDETHFEVLNRKNGTFVRRLKSESNEPFNFSPYVQGVGGSVSV